MVLSLVGIVAAFVRLETKHGALEKRHEEAMANAGRNAKEFREGLMEGKAELAEMRNDMTELKARMQGMAGDFARMDANIGHVDASLRQLSDVTSQGIAAIREALAEAKGRTEALAESKGKAAR
jgi:hypothetical protein